MFFPVDKSGLKRPLENQASWWFNHPLEKYAACQNGFIFPNKSRWQFQKNCELLPPSLLYPYKTG